MSPPSSGCRSGPSGGGWTLANSPSSACPAGWCASARRTLTASSRAARDERDREDPAPVSVEPLALAAGMAGGHAALSADGRGAGAALGQDVDALAPADHAGLGAGGPAPLRGAHVQ